jgi:uncharacterized membrane protein YebE (DUF533 family)
MKKEETKDQVGAMEAPKTDKLKEAVIDATKAANATGHDPEKEKAEIKDAQELKGIDVTHSVITEKEVNISTALAKLIEQIKAKGDDKLVDALAHAETALYKMKQQGY